HSAQPRHQAAAHQTHRQPKLQNEQIGGPDSEHHERMAVESIEKPAPAGKREIFTYGQRLDIADSAPLKIAGARVMKRVGAAPGIERRKWEDAERASEPVIRKAMPEEGAMSAIVLDHK